MQLKDIMTENAQVIDADSTLVDAARMLKSLDVGGLPVCDGEKLQGFLTDRDIVVRALAEGQDPATCKVSDIMTDTVVWCYEDEDLETASQLMQEKQIRRLMVLDQNKKLVGIVSLGDFAVETSDEALSAEALEGISAPGQPAP